jgi:hypothetical protein
MSLKECYVKLGGDYEGVCENLGLSDLCKSSSMLTEALRAGERPENLAVLKAQICTDYEQAISAIQMMDSNLPICGDFIANSTMRCVRK